MTPVDPESVTIRRVERDDADALLPIFLDRVVGEALRREPLGLTASELAGILEASEASFEAGSFMFAILVGDAVVGYAEIGHFAPTEGTAELTIALASQWRGRGVGPVALRLLIELCFEKWWFLKELRGIALPWNAASISMMGSAGMTDCGLAPDYSGQITVRKFVATRPPR